jgi:hypothetical protein
MCCMNEANLRELPAFLVLWAQCQGTVAGGPYRLPASEPSFPVIYDYAPLAPVITAGTAGCASKPPSFLTEIRSAPCLKNYDDKRWRLPTGRVGDFCGLAG